MHPAPEHPREAERLAELRALDILDTPPEERFDRLVQLAAHVLGAPIAYIAMVDSDRQWFKAKCGLTVDQTGREISFCGHAILQTEPLIIPDATKDERFADNPLVLGEPHVRFYVGCPLRGPGGHNVGTLCIADRRPRQIDAHDLGTLRQLAAMAERELELMDLVQTQQQLLHAQRVALAAQERLKHELAQAEAYVRSLLPEKLDSPPVQTDYAFVASSELGGDLFGYHWMADGPDRRLAMYMLDVCGHGVGASLLAVSAANAVRRQTLPEVDFGDPAAVLEALNAAYPMEENHGRFITAWYGVYDPQRRRLRHASAGHPPVIATGLANGTEILGEPGLVLGAEPEVVYRNQEVDVPPGARLWVYSDGAFELRSEAGQQQLGVEGLARLVADAGDPRIQVANVTRRLRDFQGREEFDDDLSLLAMTFD